MVFSIARAVLIIVSLGGSIGMGTVKEVDNSSKYGDVTRKLQSLGNPLKEYNYPEGQCMVGNIRAFQGRLYLAYGNSNNKSPKRMVYVDLKSNSIGFDNDSNDLFQEEQFTRFHIFNKELYAHSYDAFGGGAKYYVRDNQEWRMVRVNGAGDHMRDTYVFDNQVWVSFVNHKKAFFPNIFKAPLDKPDQNFRKAKGDHEVESEFEDANKFLSNSFVEFNGKLFASCFYNGYPGLAESSWGQIPFLIYYDPLNRKKGWPIAHRTPETFMPESAFPLFPSVDRKKIKVGYPITQWISVPTTKGKALLFVGGVPLKNKKHTKKVGVSLKRGLYVASGILQGERVPVSLPSLPDSSSLRMYLLRREKKIYVYSVEKDWKGEKPDQAWVHVCSDFDNLTKEESWSTLFTFQGMGLISSTHHYGGMEVLGRNFYFAESTATFGGKGASNKGYEGAGRILRFSPFNQLPDISLMNPIEKGKKGENLTFPIRLHAKASDSDGSIQKVEFFVNDQKIGEVKKSPYSILWKEDDNRKNSEIKYKLNARATDDRGEMRTSRSIIIEKK